jgi:hypothetical protein
MVIASLAYPALSFELRQSGSRHRLIVLAKTYRTRISSSFSRRSGPDQEVGQKGIRAAYAEMGKT